jgi:hypothetical protein
MLPIKTKHGLKERNIVVSDSEEDQMEDEGGNKVQEDKEEGDQEDNSLAGKEVSVVELYAKRKESEVREMFYQILFLAYRYRYLFNGVSQYPVFLVLLLILI